MPPINVIQQAGVGGDVGYGRAGVLELGGAAGLIVASGFRNRRITYGQSLDVRLPRRRPRWRVRERARWALSYVYTTHSVDTVGSDGMTDVSLVAVSSALRVNVGYTAMW